MVLKLTSSIELAGDRIHSYILLTVTNSSGRGRAYWKQKEIAC
jgi:hypothetical protein